jgi:hypothetical protein
MLKVTAIAAMLACNTTHLRPTALTIGHRHPSTGHLKLALVQAQLPLASPARSATSSSKKSSKKAAKSTKKAAKQPLSASSIDTAAMTCAQIRFQNTTRAWAAIVLSLSLRGHDVLKAAVLDSWRLLDWLEVRGLLLRCWQYDCCTQSRFSLRARWLWKDGDAVLVTLASFRHRHLDISRLLRLFLPGLRITYCDLCMQRLAPCMF